jgi:hypothetical protein
MGCCGRKREQYVNTSTVPVKANPVTINSNPSFSGIALAKNGLGSTPITTLAMQQPVLNTLKPQVSIRYRGRPPILVRGPITGKSYEFTAVQPVQLVDSRDAAIFLRMQCFTRG